MFHSFIPPGIRAPGPNPSLFSPKDHFIYCTECDTFSVDGCASHPLTITFGKGFIGISLSGYPSQIGAFNQSPQPIEKTTLLGPFMGDFIPKSNDQHQEQISKSDNAINIHDSDLKEVIGFLDPGGDLDPDVHWSFMVKSCEEEQNVSRVQYRGQIYLQVTREIQPFQEILLGNKVDIRRRELGYSASPDVSSEPVRIKVEKPSEELYERQSEADSLGNALEPNLCRVKVENESMEHSSAMNSNILKPSDLYVDALKYTLETVPMKGSNISCPHCNKAFSQRSSLNVHIKSVHLQLRDHQCPHCTKAFTQIGSLNIHIKAVHQKLRDHHCPQCDKTFTQSGSLSLHIKAVHDKLADHPCPYCEKTFSLNGSLGEHIKAVHDKLRDHQCPHCSQAFSYLGNLNRHIKTVHEKIRDHQCPHCSQTFSQKGSIKRHIKTVHL